MRNFIAVGWLTLGENYGPKMTYIYEEYTRVFEPGISDIHMIRTMNHGAWLVMHNCSLNLRRSGKGRIVNSQKFIQEVI